MHEFKICSSRQPVAVCTPFFTDHCSVFLVELKVSFGVEIQYFCNESSVKSIW